MKKLILKLTYVTALFAFMQSCDDVERVYYNDAAETVLSLSDDNLSLSEDSGANEILTLTWSDPDYGFDAAAENLINYILVEKARTNAWINIF